MAPQRLGEPSAAVPVGEPEGQIAFRVRIATTGHRHIDDERGVASGVVERLAQVRRMFPATEDTPVVFTIVTALAEGADRLVPRVAAGALGGSQVETEVVLPLTIDDYLEDFVTEASRREFRAMLGDAIAATELTHTARLSAVDRDAAYERVGYSIVDRSDVVLAVWDGRESRGSGGTADIVEHARRRSVPLLVVPTAGPTETGHAMAEKAASPETPSLLPTTLEAFRRIDEYNRTAGTADNFHGQLSSTYTRLKSAADGLTIYSKYETVAKWAVPHYVHADLLAVRHQFQYTRLGRAIHFLAAFAVTAVAVQIVFGTTRKVWLGAEIACLLLLITAVWIGRRGQVRERWIGYRSLAEAFRSALFVAMTGDSDHDDAGPEVEKRWVQRAFSEAWRQRPQVTFTEDEAPELGRFVLRGWIDDQITFHRKTAERHHARRTQYTWTVYAFAATTITVATLHIIGWPAAEGWERAFTFMAVTLPGFGAAVTGLREHGQHRVHEERSRRAAERLEQLKERLGQPTNLASVRALVADAQRIIREESVEWSGVIEFQDLEMVI